MFFNWPLVRRLSHRALFRSRGTHLRLTAKRVRVLLAFYPIFAFMQLFTRICWFLDPLFEDPRRPPRATARGSANDAVDRHPTDHSGSPDKAASNTRDAGPRNPRPLFILGNFRSGTTFLFRTLARDTRNFAAMKTWEIYLAPTRIQRLLYRGILTVDRSIGAPLMKWLRRFDSENLGAVEFHKVGLWEPEEDEGLLLYPFAGLFIWFFFPYRHAVRRFIRYDERVPPRLKRRLDDYYAACIEKHMAAHPKSTNYLAKNPSLCGKIRSVLRLYPNARFVFLQRDAVAQFRSQMSWLSFAFGYFSDPLERYPFQRFALDMAAYWSDHALNALAGLPDDRVCFVRMEELVERPKRVIEDIYRRLGYDVSESFREELDRQEERARRHRQNETVDVGELSVTEDEIRSALSTKAFEEQRRLRNAWIH